MKAVKSVLIFVIIFTLLCMVDELSKRPVTCECLKTKAATMGVRG